MFCIILLVSQNIVMDLSNVMGSYKQSLRYVGVIQTLFLIRQLCLIGVLLHEDKRTNTIKTCVSRDWTVPSDFIYYSTLNSEHNWENLYIQLRNKHTCTSNNHN